MYLERVFCWVLHNSRVIVKFIRSSQTINPGRKENRLRQAGSRRGIMRIQLAREGEREIERNERCSWNVHYKLCATHERTTIQAGDRTRKRREMELAVGIKTWMRDEKKGKR